MKTSEMMRPELLVSGLGVGASLLGQLVKKAKKRGLAKYIHLLITEDERAEALVERVTDKMTDVLEEEFLWDDIRLVWRKFYKDLFGMDADFSGVAIPEGFDQTKHWLIGIPQGLDYSRLQEAICRWEGQRNRPAPYFYQGLATILKKYEQRLPQESYFVTVGNHVNAVDGDERLAGKSSQNIHDEHLLTQNAMERLVQDMFVDWMASQHGVVQLLDQKSWTRTCSRWNDDYAVYVCRDGIGQLHVSWSGLVGAYLYGRARAVDSVS